MVAEQVLPGKTDQVAERNFLFDIFLYDCKKQVSYKCTPCLYFDGIFIVCQKIFQREVLFKLFE